MKLELGADSIAEISSALQQIDFSIVAEDSRRSVSGGCGAGYSYEITENEGMTHERYVEELNAYLATIKQNKP